jgi:predicted GNAT superfamily acetyltransferase
MTAPESRPGGALDPGSGTPPIRKAPGDDGRDISGHLEARRSTAAPVRRNPEARAQVAQTAAAAAEAAAQEAGVAIRILSDPAEIHEADRVLATIWTMAGSGSPVPAHLMRALTYCGNYVAGAWAGETIIGASVAFLALEGGSIGLHSHVTGVAIEFQGSHVGQALKLHQRAWALERGMDQIGWSFDPLIRRNGWFNLRKLRAVAVGYEPNFYGAMADRINAGDESDRCLVRWQLTAPGVGALAPCEDSDAGSTAPLLLDEDVNGYPVVTPTPDPLDESGWRCRVPADVEAWRHRKPDRARAWRRALRDTLGTAMRSGFVASTMTDDGCYVLTRPPERGEAWTGESSG